MPKGSNRYRLTREGTKFDLSAEQFAMLSRKTIKLLQSPDWKDVLRMRGLIKRGLFRKRNGSYDRTKLGSDVFTKITERLKAPKE